MPDAESWYYISTAVGVIGVAFAVAWAVRGVMGDK